MIAIRSTSERSKPLGNTLRREEMEKSIGERIYLK
jgi:hypothetical protein